MNIFVTKILPLEGPPEVNFIRAEVMFSEQITYSEEGESKPEDTVTVDLWLLRNKTLTFEELKSAAIQKAIQILCKIADNHRAGCLQL
jgi:hypothetical protein